ncbi:MAG: DUF262 domain-containing protein [Bacteroidetes bacterium]|nr:DUF262 domain-containing protein [Bacteroidota bacterium]
MTPDDELIFGSPESAVEIEETSTDSLMEKPFNPNDIRIDNRPLTIDLLIKRLKADPIEIDMQPAFQRKRDLWDQRKQSQLIESLLIKFPLPAFYFDGSDNDCWLVVDGLQRLSSLQNFIVNKTLKLKGLEFLQKLEGKGYDDLPRNLQRQIEEAQIVVYLINPGTPDEVKFNIFKRINTGGLMLNSQEIRQALNQGIPAQFVTNLAESDSFKEATSYKIDSPRMMDREFVTRFLAFYCYGYQNYIPDLDTFLNNAMRGLKNLSEQERDKIKQDFNSAMWLAKDVFGGYAFRKLDDFPRKKPFNKALFEVLSVLFAKLNEDDRESIRSNGTDLMAAMENLMKNDQSFLGSITVSTGSRANVNERFSKMSSIINEILSKC